MMCANSDHGTRLFDSKLINRTQLSRRWSYILQYCLQSTLSRSSDDASYLVTAFVLQSDTPIVSVSLLGSNICVLDDGQIPFLLYDFLHGVEQEADIKVFFDSDEIGRAHV